MFDRVFAVLEVSGKRREDVLPLRLCRSDLGIARVRLVERFLDRIEVVERIVDLAVAHVVLLGEAIGGLEVRGGPGVARIRLDRHRLRERRAVELQAHRVDAGQEHRSRARTAKLHSARAVPRRRAGFVKIPCHAVDAGFVRDVGNIFTVDFVRTRDRTHDFAVCIENLQRRILLLWRGEVVVDDCPARRIFGREVRVRAIVAVRMLMILICRARLEQHHAGLFGLRKLLHRREVIKHPHVAPVSTNDEVVELRLDADVVDRNRRHV